MTEINRNEVERTLDERLLRAISYRCTHPAATTPIISDDRFGEQCAKCLDLAYELLKVVDDTVAGMGHGVISPCADNGRTGAERYFAERMKDPEYRAAYVAERNDGSKS